MNRRPAGKSEPTVQADLRWTDGATAVVEIEKVSGLISQKVCETVAVEEPLEIQLGFGDAASRQLKSISVTMRTPGDDAALAAGFLMTEGVVRDVNDIDEIREVPGLSPRGDSGGFLRPHRSEAIRKSNTIRVELRPHVTVDASSLQRNFYTTSSCGICGKASLLALRAVCPPRAKSSVLFDAAMINTLPDRLRSTQGIFDRTGGLHAAGLFDSKGALQLVREDVGRHNAVDKLVGSEFLLDRTPLRDRLLMLSGRASFELLQKALMAGFALVASVGAPSSLAVQVARDFDIVLVGFLRSDHFNIYHGADRIRGVTSKREEQTQCNL